MGRLETQRNMAIPARANPAHLCISNLSNLIVEHIIHTYTHIKTHTHIHHIHTQTYIHHTQAHTHTHTYTNTCQHLTMSGQEAFHLKYILHCMIFLSLFILQVGIIKNLSEYECIYPYCLVHNLA
jgi:hypothetical protein